MRGNAVSCPPLWLSGRGRAKFAFEGARVTRRFRLTRCDLPRQVQYLEMIFYVRDPDGTSRRVAESFSMRHFFRYEVEHLLARCGFEVEALYSDYDKSPYGSKSPGELIFVARKT